MFRHPVYFIHHELDRWDAVCLEPPPPPHVYGEHLRGANDNWALQTYFELKRRGFNVELVEKHVNGAICIAHYDDVILKEAPAGCFLVSIRGDRPDIHVSSMTIVQNKHALRAGREFFMPHWSQAGLMPRDSARGAKVKTVGYFGMEFNLHPAFRGPEFAAGLRRMGMTLVVREYPFQNYTDIDAVLAVRPGTLYDINLKPATKLQNAWLAECPALLGVESGYRQYRRSALDYIEVDSPEKALDALKTLKENPRLYADIVENGRKRGEEFTHDKVAALWAEFIAGPVMDAYDRWLQSPLRRRWIDYPIFMIHAFQHKAARYNHMRKI